jgi:hypothetical protein
MPRAALAVLAAVALGSIGVGFARVWPELGRHHDRYAAWSADEVAHAGALHEHLATRPFDAWRAAIRPGSRYYVDVPAGPTALVYRTFATYFLLPSTPAATPAEADVVLAYRTDPRRLGVLFARIERPAPGVAVAWAR